jgi:hypothetical protein
MVSRAICLVLCVLWAGLNIMVTVEFFALLCNFLHLTAIKEFPIDASVHSKPSLLTRKCKKCTPVKARIKRLSDSPIFGIILRIAPIFASFCWLRQGIECLVSFKYKLTSNNGLRLLAWRKLQKRTIKKLKRRNKLL